MGADADGDESSRDPRLDDPQRPGFARVDLMKLLGAMLLGLAGGAVKGSVDGIGVATGVLAVGAFFTAMALLVVWDRRRRR
jgi:hypothetical protein